MRHPQEPKVRVQVPQPPAKRRRGTTSEDVHEYFVREMTRLDERRAAREERHAESECTG